MPGHHVQDHVSFNDMLHGYSLLQSDQKELNRESQSQTIYGISLYFTFC